MKAGFARICITPPIGTRMAGWNSRDDDHGCESIHDDLYARALYVAQGGEEALIAGLDLLFFSRAEADRYRGAIGRLTGLAPRQILLNTSHTHAGPMVGTWGVSDCAPTDRLYEEEVGQALLQAAFQARAQAVEVTLQAAMAHTTLPISRRRPDGRGKTLFLPNPAGTICDLLPICLLRNAATGGPVALLFSAACHPSTIAGFDISADYPGAAMAALDRYLGGPCSLFLQGAGGDTKARVIDGGDRWLRATWEMVARAGEDVAREVIGQLEAGLAPFAPDLRAAETELCWPLQPPLPRAGYQAIADNPATDGLRRRWAQRQLARLDRGQTLPVTASITLHGIQLGQGLRLVGLEGEAVAGWGLLMHAFYGQGVTFPLGYTDGAQLYLPMSPMIAEGGYEVESYYEYGFPAPLAPGMEATVRAGLERLRSAGVD